VATFFVTDPGIMSDLTPIDPSETSGSTMFDADIVIPQLFLEYFKALFRLLRELYIELLDFCGACGVASCGISM